jgi:hypothetical protein
VCIAARCGGYAAFDAAARSCGNGPPICRAGGAEISAILKHSWSVPISTASRDGRIWDPVSVPRPVRVAFLLPAPAETIPAATDAAAPSIIRRYGAATPVSSVRGLLPVMRLRGTGRWPRAAVSVAPGPGGLPRDDLCVRCARVRRRHGRRHPPEAPHGCRARQACIAEAVRMPRDGSGQPSGARRGRRKVPTLRGQSSRPQRPAKPHWDHRPGDDLHGDAGCSEAGPAGRHTSQIHQIRPVPH